MTPSPASDAVTQVGQSPQGATPPSEATGARTLEHFDTAATIALKVAIPVGFLYLLQYCADLRIPFPTLLSELPALLICVGALGVGLVLVMGGFFLLPGLGRSEVFGREYAELYRGNLKADIRAFLMLMALPVLLTMAALFADILGLQEWWWQPGMILAAAISLGASAVKGRRKRRRYTLLTAGYHFAIAWLWVFAIVALVWSSLLSGSGLAQLSDQTAVALFFGVVVGLIVLLGFMVVGGARSEVAHEVDTLASWKGWIAFGAMAIVVSALHPWSAALICRTALIALHLGGGIPVMYEVSSAMPEATQRQLGVAPGQTRTPQLRLMLDLGARTYVRSAKDEAIIQVPSEWLPVRHIVVVKQH